MYIFYETDIQNIYTYNLNHCNLINKNENKDIQKYYLYFHPIIGPNEFDNFNQYIIKKI